MGPALMSDLTDLLSRCQRADHAAFDELFDQFAGRLYRLALSILRDEKDAEDTVQETMLRVYRKLPEYRSEASFTTWVTTIAVNVCRDHLRRRKLRQALSLDWLRERPDEAHPSVPEQVDERLQSQALWRLVDSLEDRYRLPVLLIYREHLSPGEAAQALGLPLRTLYDHLRVAYTRLGAHLQTDAPLHLAGLEGD